MFFFFFFLPHLLHMEVSWPGIDLCHSFSNARHLTHCVVLEIDSKSQKKPEMLQRQCQILSPLHHSGNSPVTFLNYSFRNQDISGLWFLGQVIHGLGVCELSVPWRNSLSWYVNDTYNSNFSTLMMLLAMAVLVTWLWLIIIQLAQDWGQREKERG